MTLRSEKTGWNRRAGIVRAVGNFLKLNKRGGVAVCDAWGRWKDSLIINSFDGFLQVV